MIPAKRLRRTFTEAVKKQIAAKQQWVCSVCSSVLSSTYQVDHSIPLWKHGLDSPENATAMCAGCHAKKTQNEGIERAVCELQSKMQTRELFEQKIWREEEAKRATSTTINGSVICRDCLLNYYPIFTHKCREVARRSLERIAGKKSRPRLALDTQLPANRVFEEFYCTIKN
jgi:cytochrome c553